MKWGFKTEKKQNSYNNNEIYYANCFSMQWVFWSEL